MKVVRALADATVRQELKRLICLGVVAPRDGNWTYYHANTEHPLYPDIRNRVLKTSGLPDVLPEALTHPVIRLAFVFGSMARRNGKAQRCGPDGDWDDQLAAAW